MITRIEVYSSITDTRAQIRLKKMEKNFPKLNGVTIADVYTIDKTFSPDQLEKIASMLANPVTQTSLVIPEKTGIQIDRSRIMSGMTKSNFSFALEIGFLPGVTDNIANTARESIEDLLKIKFSENENVYTSQITFLEGDISLADANAIGAELHNPLIQRMHLKNNVEFEKDKGMDFIVPKVKTQKKPEVTTINLEISDEELIEIGKSGIKNGDGTSRGPLALDLLFMKTIQAYFRKVGRSPTDIELESIAQTWSEHCKHTIFADPIDEIKDGLYKSFIKRATQEIRKKKGQQDFCVSVFTDNSGAIAFDDNYLVTHKVETHNSPSALDPFGGSITGIVGVNRDAIGFGLGAKPVANFYGFCFADPVIDITLYKDKKKTQKMLSSRRIMDGVIEGVNAGGNQSGIPTPQGFVYFDERYRGKPLVFVGTAGLIPKKIKNHPSHLKKAKPGDLIVMIGGRVGKDGIHGATFSSEALSGGSPATAVQIGDPITQKKLSDAIVKEARDQLLYNSITDNGAGGLSCSVSEMAQESGGCIVDLEKVPLKYAGLDPWEIWISESQERMTLAVPQKYWKTFSDLMTRRGVEATVIGEFTKSGKCVVRFKDKIIMDIDMDFLHNGLPQRPMTTVKPAIQQFNNETIKPEKHINISQSLLNMLSRLNITSYAFITEQYDHMVQANLVLPPLQGKGKVNADASVIKPVLDSQRGVVLSQALYPSYSEINPYQMAACSIDTAIRNAVAAGANPDYLSLLDNFCWCSSNDPERLWQLKEAVKACYDYAVAYQTPFISGKDSMFNDFQGYDKNGNPVKISIPPTLLISSFGVINDITKVVSLDAKNPGDIVYILGETHEELGGSEYFAVNNVINDSIPRVDAAKNRKLYLALYKAIQKNLVASSISISRGGIGVALARKAIGGMLGLTISLKHIPGKITKDDLALYSETQGRMLVTINPDNKEKFEKVMKGNLFVEIGKVTSEPVFRIKGLGEKTIIETKIEDLEKAYKKTFRDY